MSKRKTKIFIFLLILVQSITIPGQAKKNQPQEKPDDVKIPKAVYNTGRELFLLDFVGYTNFVRYGNVSEILICCEPVSNVYYKAKMTETNGIAYEIDPKRQQRIYFPELENKIFYCMYAGNISPKERLYIHTNDNNMRTGSILYQC